MFHTGAFVFIYLFYRFMSGFLLLGKWASCWGGGCNGTRNLSIGGYPSYLSLEYFELLNVYPIGIAVLVPVR